MDSAITVFRKTKNTAALDELICELKTRATGSEEPLSPTIVSLLIYFRKIEFLVMEQYAKEVRMMPSYYHDDIREFGIMWEQEETRHGVAIEEYLRIHGHILDTISHNDVGIKYQLTTLWLVCLAWLFWFVSPAIHMLVGFINEVTTKAGYWAFMKHVTDPELRKIISLIQGEEMRHMDFYQSKCLELLGKKFHSKFVSDLLFKYWKPVGAGNADVRSFAKILLADEDISKGFFAQMEKRFEKIGEQIPPLPNFVIGYIKSLI